MNAIDKDRLLTTVKLLIIKMKRGYSCLSN